MNEDLPDDDDDDGIDYAELDRRRQEVEDGTVKLIPWSEVRKKLNEQKPE